MTAQWCTDMRDPKADDPKAGADVGKIVNLMAGDANRVRDMLRLHLSRI